MDLNRPSVRKEDGRYKMGISAKTNATGHIGRYKEGLVAMGFCHNPAGNIAEIYSPVVKYGTLCFFLALEGKHWLNMLQMDLKSPFLNEDLYEELYMA